MDYRHIRFNFSSMFQQPCLQKLGAVRVAWDRLPDGMKNCHSIWTKGSLLSDNKGTTPTATHPVYSFISLVKTRWAILSQIKWS